MATIAMQVSERRPFVRRCTCDPWRLIEEVLGQTNE
jgi:hypothetical protein